MVKKKQKTALQKGVEKMEKMHLESEKDGFDYGYPEPDKFKLIYKTPYCIVFEFGFRIFCANAYECLELNRF